MTTVQAKLKRFPNGRWLITISPNNQNETSQIVKISKWIEDNFPQLLVGFNVDVGRLDIRGGRPNDLTMLMLKCSDAFQINIIENRLC